LNFSNAVQAGWKYVTVMALPLFASFPEVEPGPDFFAHP
jgi:hypothetical protein